MASDFGWMGSVVVTPHYHHGHRPSDEGARDRKLRRHTPVFDLVFRSYHQPQER
jgi:sterol desaturase/sphingolipid hydroxylase (fatty acid hydroxylase superfamily)